MGVRDYSTTAGNNGSVSSQTWSEGQAPSTVNNSARKLLADLADLYELEHGLLTTGGTANAQTLTPSVAWTAYSNGNRILVKIGAGLTNTGAATLNVSSLGAKSVLTADGSALVGGELVAGQFVELIYSSDSGAFRFVAALTLDQLTANGADIASASTIDLDAATGDCVDVTGTTAITAITLAAGDMRIVRFTDALTLTHGASLVLPGAANITTAAGDFAIFRGYASSVVRCIAYSKANGQPVAIPAASQSEMEAASSNTVAATPGRMQYHPGVIKIAGTFDGTAGTPNSTLANAINVSSITDNGTGDWTVNLTTAMSSANYPVIVTGNPDQIDKIGITARTTTSFRIEASTGGVGTDCSLISFMCVGDFS